ncbi:hypothetical protein K438DRAFT_1767900 [Mycena galopus ATCC 62051]|nr:hypothetical protein K438DRAFT_1767900 [Mycena galopus ATCC 62051]
MSKTGSQNQMWLTEAKRKVRSFKIFKRSKLRWSSNRVQQESQMPICRGKRWRAEKGWKPRAKRAASKRGKHDEDSKEEEDEDEEVQVKVRPRKKQVTRTHTSASRPQARTDTEGEEEDGNDEGEDKEREEEDEDEEPRKPIAQMSVAEKRAWLLKLGRAKGGVKTKATAKGKAGPNGKEKGNGRAKERTKARKRKRGDDEGREGGKKRTKRDAEQVGGAKRRAPDEEEGRRKKQKQRFKGRPAGQVKPRPKPTPAWKGTTASSSRLDDTMLSAAEAPTLTDSGAGSSGTRKNTVRGEKGRKGPPGWHPDMH